MYRSKKTLPVLIALAIFCVLPYAAVAQEADLRTTIRAELLQDPRTAQLSEAELDSMVTLLAQEAQKEGVSAQDISWRAGESRDTIASADAPAQRCDGYPEFFCNVQHAFGFDGSNMVIPLGLLVTSGLLWFLLYELRHHHTLGHIQ